MRYFSSGNRGGPIKRQVAFSKVLESQRNLSLRKTDTGVGSLIRSAATKKCQWNKPQSPLSSFFTLSLMV